MILRFASYEEAGIYAGWMRSEGHFSAILDENMGFMWGPLAIGGFRVLVTDEPVTHEEPLPAAAPAIETLLNAIRVAVVAFTLLGLIAALWLGTKLPAYGAADWIAGAMRGGLVIAIFCGMAPLMIPATRALRDERSLFGGCIRGLVVIHVAAQGLVMCTSLVYAIWHEAHHH